MHCPHCRTANEPGGERCVHCGRRLQSEVRPAIPIRSAALPVTALELLPGEPAPDGNTAPAEQPTPSYQPSLFRDGSRDGAAGKVIPIPTLTPLHPYHRETAHRRQSARTASSRAVSSRTNRRAEQSRSDYQQMLGFHEATPPEVRVQPGESIDCDAPVAAPVHRLLATAVDAGLILVGVGVFLAIFFLSGGQVALDRQALSFLIGVTAVISLFYRALWCLADGDSPGMRFAGLRLVDFDGRRPDREQRGIRQIANLLSLLSAGLGLVWALVDEENLTWHDHISKTFPTPQ